MVMMMLMMLMHVEHDDADGDDNYDDDEYEDAAMAGRDCEHPSHGGIAARQHGYGDDAAWW